MAYHSMLDRGTYHECKNCTKGNNIEARYLKEGKPDGAKLCDECAKKKADGSCKFGTPTPAR